MEGEPGSIRERGGDEMWLRALRRGKKKEKKEKKRLSSPPQIDAVD